MTPVNVRAENKSQIVSSVAKCIVPRVWLNLRSRDTIGVPWNQFIDSWKCEFFASLAEFIAINKQKGSKEPLIAFARDGHRVNSLKQPTFSLGWQKPSRSIIFFHGAIKKCLKVTQSLVSALFQLATLFAGPSSLEPPEKARPVALFPRPASVLCLDVRSVPFSWLCLHSSNIQLRTFLTNYDFSFHLFRSWRDELVLLTSERGA